MLKTQKKILSTPALLAGVIIFGFQISSSSNSFAEEQLKPSIQNLTNEATQKKVQENKILETGEQNVPRIPTSINKHSVGVGLGQTFLRSDLGENGNDKITPDIYYNYSASHSFDFMANFHWSNHSYLNREATIKGLALSIKGKGYQYDSFSPFVLGGFGFYAPSATRIVSGVPTETRSQMVFGMNLGIGCELRLNSDVIVGVVAHYHDPFDVRQEVGPKLEGSYMKLLLLALYTFN